MAGFKTFDVGDNKYRVQQMPPDVAFRFGTRVAAIVAPVLSIMGKEANGKAIEMIAQAFTSVDPDKVSSICEEAREYIFSPRNMKLSNAVEFNEWFAEHPSDMFMVNVIGVWKLVEDFFPKVSAMPVIPILSKGREAEK